jgi:YaaC-like Protein
MIINVSDIVSENPIKQIWKLLHLFLDPKYTSNQIRLIHPEIPAEHEGNIKKQAMQIAYCIRQAEEYFQASTQVGLATRPVLLYYGAVALSKALILLKKDGNYSLDSQRNNPAYSHKHHGLEPVNRLTSKNVGNLSIEEFFSAFGAKLYVQPQSKIPWGNFPLFYDSLVPQTPLVTITYHKERKVIPVPTYSIPHLYSISEITPILELPNEITALDLMCQLPDMYYILRQLGIECNLARGSCTVDAYYSKNDDSSVSLIEQSEVVRKVTYRFFINPHNETIKGQISRYFKENLPHLELEMDQGLVMKYGLLLEYTSEGAPKLQIPGIIDSMNGEHFYTINEDLGCSKKITAQFDISDSADEACLVPTNGQLFLWNSLSHS